MMRQLGYDIRGIGARESGMAGNFKELLVDPPALAGMLAGLQVAFGLIGWHQIRAARRRSCSIPPLFPRPHGGPVVSGIVVGLATLGFGQLYAKGLEAFLHHPAPSPWDGAAALPIAAKLVLLIFGAVGAPVTEELFFRGYLFGMFRSAGYVWFGICASAILFGACHFSDVYNVPGICAVGVLLAWLYYRTGSLLAPIIAHVLNNAIQIALLI